MNEKYKGYEELQTQSFVCKEDYQLKGFVNFVKGEIYSGVLLGRGIKFTDKNGKSIYFLTAKGQRKYFEVIAE